MTRAFLFPAFFLLACLALSSCGSDSTTESPAPVSAEKAQGSILDMEISWYDFGGNLRIFVVQPEDLIEEPSLTSVSIETDDGIERREAWKVPVAFSDGSAGWFVYLDAVTTERLLVEQLFQT